jgi:hypothetical protein
MLYNDAWKHIFFLIVQVEISSRIMLYISAVFQNLQSDFISGYHNQIQLFADMINYVEK